MEGVGASVNELLDELGDLGSGGPFLREALDLLGGRDLSGEEEPEERFGQRLRSTRGGRELLLTFRDGEASESDTLIGVKDGSLPDQALTLARARSKPTTKSRRGGAR